MRYIWFAILGAGLAGAAIFLFDDFNRFGAFGSGGFVESGSVLGIEVGMDRAAAARQLSARGLERTEPTAPGRRCFGRRDIPPDEDTELWLDRSWRRGVIRLCSKDGKIASVEWSYGGWKF